MIEYKVIRERKSETYSLIKIKMNDLVECIQESDKNGDWTGWIYGIKKSNGMKAWVAFNHMRKL